MMRRKWIAIGLPVVVLAGVLAGVSASALAGGGASGGISLSARLSSYSEVPAISSTATGMFTATVSPDLTQIDYELTFSGLSSNSTASHIHFGQPGANGGVVAFLCGGGGKPVCPATEGTVTGTIVAADVLDLTAQGIAAGELDELITAIAKRVTYVNLHSASFPSGELRGQIRSG